MLAQSDGHFAQVLEGRTEAVHELLEKIRLDPRHRNLRVLLEERVVKRQVLALGHGPGAARRQGGRDAGNAPGGGCVDDAQARRLIDTLLSSAP